MINSHFKILTVIIEKEQCAVKGKGENLFLFLVDNYQKVC